MIKVTKPIKDLTLRQVLDVICKTATVKMPDGRTAGLKFTVEEYAVVFSPKLPEQASLFARTFKVDPETFIRGLRSVVEPISHPMRGAASTGGRLPDSTGKLAPGGVGETNTTNEINRMVRDVFIAAGISGLGETNRPSETQIFFNDRTGLIMVRASLQDLEIIQQAVEFLNYQPPQVLIEAKFVAIDQNDDKAAGFDWFLGNTRVDLSSPTNKPSAPRPTVVIPQPDSKGGVTNWLVRTNAPGLVTITGILTAPQFAVVMRALEQRDPPSVMSLPKTTTTSGKLAVIELPAAAKAKGGLAQVLKLEVLPTVAADGYTLNLAAIMSRDGKAGWVSQCVVWDAQTMMVGFPNAPEAAQRGANTRRIILFLTPTIVDAAGNRIHAPTDEPPFAPAGSQPPTPSTPTKK
ncbi:MAG: hypothetical protein RL514_2104 [Verrucomicrobiota bacterium]